MKKVISILTSIKVLAILALLLLFAEYGTLFSHTKIRLKKGQIKTARSSKWSQIREASSKVTGLHAGESYHGYCDVTCTVSQPCTYPDEVDFRIIVITFNRSLSLEKCLKSVLRLDTLGDLVSVEVWIDRSSQGKVDHHTIRVAKAFQHTWQSKGKGRACVHVQDKHAFIGGQWIDTWRPKKASREIGLILEDDTDVSPLVYRWLRAVHQHYGHRGDISGYTTHMEEVRYFQGKPRLIKAPQQDTVFMYGVLGTWGFSPHPERWRDFQDWYHRVRQAKTLKPYVQGLVNTEWYRQFEKEGKEDSMWEMWHIYYSHINKLFCIYPNLLAHTDQKDLLLSFNRKEEGLHYSKGNRPRVTGEEYLMETWNDSYVVFPEKTVQFAYNGRINNRV